VGVVAAALLFTARARAYRPFDGTDAAVADVHEVELELGTFGYYRRASAHYLSAPGTILNYGFADRFELVLQAFNFDQLDQGVTGPRDRVLGTGAFVKSVLRKGCLQDQSGVSLATENGPILPTINDEKGFGFSSGWILTTCTDDLIVHWNAVVNLQREARSLDLFGGAILEAPAQRLVVRDRVVA